MYTSIFNLALGHSNIRSETTVLFHFCVRDNMFFKSHMQMKSSIIKGQVNIIIYLIYH